MKPTHAVTSHKSQGMTWEDMQKAADYQPLDLDNGCVIDIFIGTESAIGRMTAATLKESPEEIDCGQSMLFGTPYESYPTLNEVHERAVELRMQGKKICVLGE